MDFGDQLARAAQVARDHPEVGAIERDRYRVVLLDEYQDTSHAQVVLLNSLFGGGHPVTAVGDPCQSIYGWRGASAGTLDRFPAEFTDRAGRPARTLSLTTSWRNRPEILTVANHLAEPLRAAGARVPRLRPALSVDEPIPTRTPHGAAGGTVHCALLPSYADEAEWIADSVLAAWRGDARMPDALPEQIPVTKRPTTAVLVRVRSQIPPIEAALRAPGPAGRGGRTRRAARHPRGARRGLHAAGARRSRPTGRRCCACSPAPGGASVPATWWRCTAGPGRSPTRARS